MLASQEEEEGFTMPLDGERTVLTTMQLYESIIIIIIIIIIITSSKEICQTHYSAISN